MVLINLRNTSKYCSTRRPSSSSAEPAPAASPDAPAPAPLPLTWDEFFRRPRPSHLLPPPAPLFFSFSFSLPAPAPAPAPAAASRSLLCNSLTFPSMRSITFRMTLECLHGWTLAIDNPLECGNGSIVTVFCAWSAETSASAEVGGKGRFCCGGGHD